MPFLLSWRTEPSPGAPGARRVAPPIAILALVAAAVWPHPLEASERGLEEKILESKYRRGDYAVYVGWHDPWDWQFDEHGTFAVPVGIKVRFKWLDWLRVEGDAAYYRRGEDPPIIVSLFKAPQFDGLMVGGTLQVVPRRAGIIRPYAGAGVIAASLGNDFIVFRPDVRDADPSNPDQFALASWSQLDVGVQVQGGVDFFLSHRVFPFVEYRHLFGEVTLDEGDVTIGAFAFDPGELHTIPENGGDGRPHSRRYDWSGPVVVGGLKVRF